MESFLILKFLNSYLNQIGAVMSTHLELHPPSKDLVTMIVDVGTYPLDNRSLLRMP
jgi:hypothetical protein